MFVLMLMLLMMFSLLVSNVFADGVQQLLAELINGCQCFIWMDILPGISVG